MRKNIYITFFISITFLFVGSCAEAAKSSGLVDGIWFSESPVTDFGEVTVYSVIHNQSTEQLEGIATLVVNGKAVGAQEVRVAKNDIQRISIPYHFSSGTYAINMNFTAGNGTEVSSSGLSTRTVRVVQDTDGDGTQNSIDTDDDNDGIEDSDDAEPLIINVQKKEPVALTTNGKAFLDKVVSTIESKTIASSSKEVDPEKKTVGENSGEQGAIKTAISTIEEVRKNTAVAVRNYQEDQASALTDLVAAQESLATVEGFEVTPEQQAKKHELQIASAGASVASVMLEQAWLFYMEIVVLTLSTTHLFWVWFKRRFENLGVEEEEED